VLEITVDAKEVVMRNTKAIAKSVKENARLPTDTSTKVSERNAKDTMIEPEANRSNAEMAVVARLPDGVSKP
jgi:hypothetical protein